MEALFRQVGIYSHVGQLYEPVDRDTLLYYKEAQDGQILEEGITAAGSLASFIAAGTAHSTHGIHMIPFFIFYSMFGFQRVGDLIWAAADSRVRGFLIGGTSGRTTLAGEGLQHQDGNSHLLAYPVPNLMAYDPAFAYELAVIIRDGIRQMYERGQSLFYYVTVTNENYAMPAMPKGVEEGILKGIYKVKASGSRKTKVKAQLFGSGAILNEALKAQALLNKYGVAADVWSVTSYKQLHVDGEAVGRWNMLHPEDKPKLPYLSKCLAGTEGPIVAASDYVKALPESVSRWCPRPFVALGTDGFGRSEGRKELRDFFEVDSRFITLATLNALVREGKIEAKVAMKAMKDLEIDPDKVDPLVS
jgi:pyruvate dehydrogenase E1 component